MGKRLRTVLVLTAIVVIAGGGAAVWAASGSSVAGYRTVAARPEQVTATLDLTGTIEPVSQASVSFPTSGQVSSVPVQVGQQVTTGQTIAQLDTTSLAGQLATAQSTLASTQAKLASDQSGQSSAAAGSGGHATPAAYFTTSAPTNLKSQQDAVTAAQHQVDLDLTDASAAIADQQKACQTVVQPTTPDSGNGSAAQDSGTPPASQDDVDACTTAIQKAQDAQTATAADEKKLADAENTLSETLAQLAATPSPSPSTSPKPGGTPSTNAPGPSSRSGSSKSSPGGSGGSSSLGQRAVPVSAEQLAADQAAIDSANAQVAVAQQNLAAATLVSPIDGTVAQIGFTVGQQAGQQHIVVVGPGANQVTTAVSDTQAGQIKPGQQAKVTPDGSGQPITGQVTSIGLLASTASSGSPSYPVTISLPSSTQPLYPGATASVSIITSTANAAVTVPTSAVHLQGAGAFVTVLANGTPEVRRVTVGVIGPSVTEIRTGLTAGEQVVLADLSQALPTSNTNTRGLVGGAGGGAQRFAGGAGGAGGAQRGGAGGGGGK